MVWFGRPDTGLHLKLLRSVINSYEYRSGYVEAGSLTTFAVSIEQLQAEGYLVPRSKSEKYKNTAVDSVYWLAESATSYEGWSESSMLRISDVKQLRLDYYRTHPQEQTMETWGYIERVYDFYVQQRTGKLLRGKNVR